LIDEVVEANTLFINSSRGVNLFEFVLIILNKQYRMEISVDELWVPIEVGGDRQEQRRLYFVAAAMRIIQIYKRGIYRAERDP
jgi:hypothetical protein